MRKERDEILSHLKIYLKKKKFYEKEQKKIKLLGHSNSSFSTQRENCEVDRSLSLSMSL